MINGRTAVEDRYEELATKFKELAKEASERPPEALAGDFVFLTTAGPVRLADCFEGKRDLIVIHNMGTCCSCCTMWADGFNGVQAHLRDRAGLVLVSPDKPEVVEDFARRRGWRFPVVSGRESGFTEALDLGTSTDPYPGFSTLHLNDHGQIERISSECFGDFDLYSPVWHMLGRLKGGIGDWQPKFQYGEEEGSCCGK